MFSQLWTSNTPVLHRLTYVPMLAKGFTVTPVQGQGRGALVNIRKTPRLRQVPLAVPSCWTVRYCTVLYGSAEVGRRSAVFPALLTRWASIYYSLIDGVVNEVPMHCISPRHQAPLVTQTGGQNPPALTSDMALGWTFCGSIRLSLASDLALQP